MGSLVRRSPVVASAAVHLALLGWLMQQQPHTVFMFEAADQPVAMVFEAPPEPAPAKMPDAAAMPEPPAEPIAAAAPPEPAAEPPATPTPELDAPAAPPPAPVPAPLPATAAPLPAAPSPPPLRPKPATARPVRPAPAAAPAPSVPSGPAIQAPGPQAAAPPNVSAAADPGWRAALGNWIAAHKRYPERARQRGDEGTVGIRFTVDPAGRVLDVAVTHSSGSALLDDAAREMLAGQRVPAFPPAMTLAQVAVPVNIRFQLEQ